VGQKLHMNNISFPVFFYDLHMAINCWSTVWPNVQNGIKAGEEKITVRGNFTAMMQNDGNLRDDQGNTLKMDTIQDHNRNTGYVKNLSK
jgi:hypothetical protein